MRILMLAALALAMLFGLKGCARAQESANYYVCSSSASMASMIRTWRSGNEVDPRFVPAGPVFGWHGCQEINFPELQETMVVIWSEKFYLPHYSMRAEVAILPSRTGMPYLIRVTVLQLGTPV